MGRWYVVRMGGGVIYGPPSVRGLQSRFRLELGLEVVLEGGVQEPLGEAEPHGGLRGQAAGEVGRVAQDHVEGRIEFDGSVRDLMAVDVKTGSQRMLLEDARIGEIAFNPADRSLMGVKHENGYAILVRIPHPYDTVEELHRFGYEDVPYDLDISPDGRWIAFSSDRASQLPFARGRWEHLQLADIYVMHPDGTGLKRLGERGG